MRLEVKKEEKKRKKEIKFPEMRKLAVSDGMTNEQNARCSIKGHPVTEALSPRTKQHFHAGVSHAAHRFSAGTENSVG